MLTITKMTAILPHWLVKSFCRNFSLSSIKNKKNFSAKYSSKFGIIFDIDGVLLRGSTVISAAKEAFQLLVNSESNKFVIPCVFCTNAFGLPNTKAAALSKCLDVEIMPKQMVMSQTPLHTFQEFHNKWCLVSGPDHDGGAVQVAQSLGFNKTISIDDIRHAFPFLDWIDRSRWPSHDIKETNHIPTIEAVVLLGEPVRWETNLQLIIDVLTTNGRPNQIAVNNETQIPVIATNTDLQWMAKANSPRFGHGAFLLCLEHLYKKISGRDLVYTALVGKPSEITYGYTQNLISKLAFEMHLPEIERLYMIGFVSMLVCTGVFKPNKVMLGNIENLVHAPNLAVELSKVKDCRIDHGHRDMPFCAELTKPDFVVKDVKHAIQKIFELENISSAH